MTATDESSSFFRLLTAVPRPQELTGAFNLLSHYGLRDQYETFCRKPLPSSIAESQYLPNAVGNADIRKGEGMELVQVLHTYDANISDVHIQPFDLDVLRQAFTLRESGRISLTEADHGLPTISSKVRDEQKEKEKKHKKHKKHKERRKDKDKDRHKDKEKEKDREKYKDKDHSKKRENGEDHTKKHHKKKRKHEGDEEEGEVHKHKKKKHKHSSKTEALELAKKGKLLAV
eukprot:c28001_g2_i1 orf=508-1200(+)